MTTLIEFARLIWQTTREVPGFYLSCLVQLADRLQAHDTLEAAVGRDEARMWLVLTGDAQAALNLVQAGYSLEQVMEIKEGLRS